MPGHLGWQGSQRRCACCAGQERVAIAPIALVVVFGRVERGQGIVSVTHAVCCQAHLREGRV